MKRFTGVLALLLILAVSALASNTKQAKRSFTRRAWKRRRVRTT